MNQFLNIARYEYRMSIRRLGGWLAFGVVAIFYFASFALAAGKEEMPAILTREMVWSSAGEITFFLNMFLPVVAGIAASDRMLRDRKLNVNELQSGTPLSHWTYLLSKYTGVLAALLTPVLVFDLLMAMFTCILYPGTPLMLIPVTVLAFLAINVPAYAFLTVFSLACPLVMPLRVYQVLFTGYWFWGNFLSPSVLPTLSDTYLTPSGKYAMQAFFGRATSINSPTVTSTDAIINLVVLALCILAALVVTKTTLTIQSKRA